MEELKHYVYVYLNPLKPRKFSYMENGIGIYFDYEPFYIGKGCDTRLVTHLKEAKKYQEIIEEETIEEEKPKYNKHKINTINKINREGKDVIIYKICENLEEQVAYLLERLFIKLIGRSDKKLGPLTNLTDGGEGSLNPSQELIDRRIKSFKNTLKNNPEIQINITKNRLKTEANSPEIRINAGKKISETKQKFSKEKKLSIVTKFTETYGSGTDLRIDAIEKFTETYGSGTELRKQAQIKLSDTLNLNTTICKERSKLANLSKCKNMIQKGKNHPLYVKVFYELIIKEFFNFKTINQIKILYNKIYKTSITSGIIRRVFNILGLPTLNIRYNKNKQERFQFIEENKHKIQWYIDNYERLEEEYFLKNFYKNNKDILALLK